MNYTKVFQPARTRPPRSAMRNSLSFIPAESTRIPSTGRHFSSIQVPDLFEGQTNVIFRESGRGCAGTCDVIEFRKLASAIELAIACEFMQHRSHPPGKALDFPHAAQTNL